MALAGLNVTFEIIRQPETMDTIGGSSYGQTSILKNIDGRMSNSIGSGVRQMLKDAGYETLKMFKIIAQLGDLDVSENDLVQITGGVNNGLKFTVRFVQKDSILPSDGRSHVELIVERLDYSRNVP